MNIKNQNELVRRHIRNVDKSSQKVLFYTKSSSVYKNIHNKWIETGLEGACILYTKFGNLKVLSVFSRKRKQDLFLCISEEIKIKKEGNIVIVINLLTKLIYGIWFCDLKTTDEVFNLLNGE